MINILLYENGFEIKGHAEDHICSEVSCMSWAYANSIYHVDKTAEYYQSAVDNPDNPQEGYSWLTFNADNEKTVWLFDEYKHNIRLWIRNMSRGHAVKIKDRNMVLYKPTI